MAIFLLWFGIFLIVAGWLALAWQASKRMAIKDERVNYPDKKNLMRLRRGYCFLTILVGMGILLGALLI